MKKIFASLLALALLASPALAGTIFVDTGGSATFSGSTDSNSATATGTAATVAGTTVTLDVSTNLGTVNTSGPNQTSINIAGATNTNRTIFWITSVTSGCTGTAVACVIVVDTAPTGVTSNSWAVGGRYLWPSGSTVDKAAAALRAGDLLQFNNTPATRTATYLTATASGDSTSGPITIQGKTGVMPVLEITNTTVPLTLSGQSNYLIQNIALKQDGASGNVISAGGSGIVVSNAKITGGGTAGVGVNNTGATTVINSEITNCGTAAVNTNNGVISLFGNYIHDNQGDGIVNSAVVPTVSVVNNIFDTNAGKGIYISGAATTQANSVVVSGNTIYANGNGLQVDDADIVLTLTNNIFSSNTSHNVNWAAGAAEFHGFHGYNTFFNGTQTGLTVNATETTSDPLMANPAGGNFAIGSSSPAKGTGFPGVLLGSATTGYMDMGAAQIQAVAGGGSQVFGQ